MKRILLTAVLACMGAACVWAQPKVVAHRGFYTTGDSFENTISSLANAQQLGVYGVEFDVNLTSDDRILILHGPNVHGTDVNVQKSTFDQVRALTLPGGHKVPTLHEWLVQGAKCPSCKLIMELKKHSTPQRETQLVEAVLAEIRGMGMDLSQFEFISFSLHAIQEVKRLEPAAFTCYVSSNQRAYIPAQLHEMGVDALSYELNVLMNFPEMVDQANALGMPTTLWMVEDPELIDWAFRHGVTFISTDFPDKSKAYIDALSAYKNKDKQIFYTR